MTQANNAKPNALGYYIQFAAVSATSLFAAPILLSYLGSATFGTWRLVLRAAEIVTFADGRIGQLLKSTLARAIGRNESESSLSAQVSAGKRFTAKRVAFLAALSVLIASITVYSDRSISLPLNANTFAYIAAAFTASALTAFVAIPEAALTAAGLAYLSAATQTLGGIMTAVIQVVIAYLKLPPAYLGLSISIAALATLTAMELVAKIRLPWYAAKVQQASAKQPINELAGASTQVSAWFGTEKLLLSSDLLLISLACGVNAVAQYTFSSYLFQLGVAVSLLGASARTPFLAQAYAAKNHGVAGELEKDIKRRAFLVTGVTGLVIIAFNRIFVELWTSHEMYLGRGADVVMALALVQLGAIRTECQLQDAQGNFKRKTIVCLAFITMSFSAIWTINKFIALSPTLVLMISLAAKLPIVPLLRRRADHATV